MKLIKPSFLIKEQEPGLEGIYKQIEYAGRICYKSSDKITEDSAKPFVDRIIKLGHGAMLEHGTIYLMIDCSGRLLDIANKYVHNKYSRWSLHKDGKHYCITTNLRVLVENGWLDDLKYLCEPTEFHEKRISVHFIADIGTMREFFRHRTMSMSQESTRYCNYSKDKFNNQLTFIIPSWCNIPEEMTLEQEIELWNKDETSFERRFMMNCLTTEANYMILIDNGYTPEQARAVLPLSLKAEAVMTGFASDWKHFFDLRALGTTGTPHPQAKELAEPLFEEFKAKGLIK